MGYDGEPGAIDESVGWPDVPLEQRREEGM